MGTRTAAQVMEDKYLNLRAAHEELKAKSNTQENTIVKLGTKLAMIEETLKRKRDGKEIASETNGTNMRKKLDKDTEDLISSLRRQNNQLKQDKLKLSEEVRVLREQLRRRPPTAGRSRSGSASRRNSSSSAQGNLKYNSHQATNQWQEKDNELLAALESFTSDSENMRSGSNNRHQELVAALKTRLLTTQDRMQDLHSQNLQLREQLRRREPDRNNNNGVPMNQSEVDDTNILTLQREIKDKNSQVTILRGRYEHLEAKARAAAEIHERTVHLLEEGNRNIRDLRRKIQALQHENETLVLHQQRAEETEQEMQNLKDESRLLEERMTALCESPFINDAFEARSRIEKLLSLEQQDRQQRLQIDHLKETAKMHHAEILTLKNTIEQLSEQRESLIQENDSLKIRTSQLERGSSILEEKVMLYTGEGDIDPTELEKALTIVKRKTENPSQVDFLEHLDEASGSVQSLPSIKRKMQELQIVHLSTTRDLERAERMLKAQANINRDLNAEVRELNEKLKGDHSELLQKLDDFETLAAKRLHKIHALEAQVKQLLHQQKRLTRSKAAFAAGMGTEDDSQHDITDNLRNYPLLRDDDEISVLSLTPSDADFGPGENLIEIWVLGAKLLPEKVDNGATTFLMVDFFDFETQTSPLLTSVNPDYNFAAIYKIEVDHFLIRYLATERLTIEFNRTRHTNYELLGTTSLSLRPLLQGNGRMVLQDAEIISTLDGSVLGTMKIKVRLALPIQELYELYLREHPEERDRMRLLKQADQDEAEEAAARARAQNQLEISIKSCTALGNSKDREPPSPYVHYQLLSFADTFTPSVRDSADPVFDHVLPFPLNVDRKLLRFLKKEKLVLNVFDENKRSEDHNESDESLIGVAKISLSSLVQGKAISGTFPLVDRDGRPSGGITIRIAWKSPLSLSDVGGPMALSSEQLNAIFTRFDIDADGRVAWKRFLSEFALPDKRRFGLQTRMRQVIARAKEQKIDYAAVIEQFDKDMDGKLTVTEVERAMKQLNMNMTQDEGLLLHTYLADAENKIAKEVILEFAQPPDHILLTAERKVRGAFAEFDARGQDVESCFAERNHGGRLSRKDFKLALVELGFILLEEERIEYLDPRAQPDWADVDTDSKQIEHATSAENDEEDGEEIQEQGTSDARELEDNTNQRAKQMELEFQRRKQEFEDRMQRARTATAAAVDVEQYDDTSVSSALKLQTNFRGYRARKAIREGKISTLSGARPNMNDVLPLVEAETALRQALAEAAVRSKSGKAPDLHKLCVAIDKQRTGVMSSRDFERVMTDSGLNLSSEHVATIIAAFKNEEGNVEWAEIVNFLAFVPRDIATIADQLRNAILRISTTEAFRVFDQNEDGIISNREFKQGLKAMDFNLSEADISALLQVFDTDGLGEIQYEQFVEFAQSQEIALELQKTEDKLRELITRAQGRGVNLETSFRHFDRNKDGVISRKEFKRVLREMGFDLHEKEVKSLFARFDPFDHGKIEYRDFVAVMQNKTSNSNIRVKKESSEVPLKVDIVQLQKRCMNVVRKIARQGQGILYAFEHYDWKSRGVISRDQFQAALIKAGFFLSASESDLLAEKFTSKKAKQWIQYRDFVRWSTPSVAHINSVVEKLRFLINESAKRANGKVVDYRPAFRVFDVDGTGEVSRRNFKEGMSTLNWDLTDEEVRAVMDYFDQNGDGYIGYEEFVHFLSSGAAPVDTTRTAIRQVHGNSLLKIAKSIENRLASNGSTLETCLEPLRKFEKTGRAPINDFESVLIDIGATGLSASDIRELVENFAVEHKDGFVDIKEFEDAVYKSVIVPRKTVPLNASGESAPLEEAMSQLREHFVCARLNGIDYRIEFEKFDNDYSGHITEAEFLQALNTLQFTIPDSSLRTLLARYNVASTHHAKVSYRSILQQVIPQEEAKELNALGKGVNQKLVNRMQGDKESKMKVFKRTKRGGVSRMSFKNGLVLLDIELDDSEVRHLMDQLDPDETGEIPFSTLSEFLDGDFVLQPRCHEPSNGSFPTSDVKRKLADHSPMAVYQRVCSEAVRQGKSLRMPFEKLDGSLRGSVDTESFLVCLEEIGFDMLDNNIKAFVAKFDQDATGQVDYLQFIHAMHPRPLMEGEGPEVWKLEEALRLKIRKRELDTGSLHSPFGFFAGKRKVCFKLKDLGRGMAEIGLPCSQSDGQALFKLLDLNMDGECTFDEFAVFARDPDYRDVPHRLRTLMVKRHGQWGNAVTDVRKLFRKVDQNESGFIDLQQLAKIIRSLDLTFSEVDMKRIMNRYDAEGNGQMKYEDFIELLNEAAFHGTSAAESISEVRRKCCSIAKLLHKLEQLDEQHQGTVRREALVAALDDVSSTALSEGDLKRILECFDFDKNGQIFYYDLVGVLQGEPEVSNTSRSKSNTRQDGSNELRENPLGSMELSVLKKRVRTVVSKLRKRGVSVRNVYEQFDRNFNGSISTKEFHEGLVRLGYDASQSEIEQLVAELDHDGSGSIDYLEFVRFLKPTTGNSDGTSTNLWKMEEMLRSKIRKRETELGDLRFPFVHFAGKSKREFGLRELGRGMSKVGIDCTKEEAELLFSQMDLNNDGRITYDEFAVFVRDPDYRDVEHRIQAAIMSRRGGWNNSVGDTKRLFRKIDRNESGTISANELVKVMERAGLKLSSNEIQRIVNRYDKDGDGEMNWEEFQTFLDENAKRAQEAAEMIEDIRESLKESGHGSDKDMKRAFMRFDVNQNGSLSTMEFLSGLEDMGFRPKPKEVTKLVQCFDFDGDGQISYEEFVDFLHGNTRAIDASDPDVENLFMDLRSILHKDKKNGWDYRKLFEQFDSDYSGEISRTEFIEGIEKLGLHITENLGHKLFDRFTSSQDANKIDYRTFLEMLLPMSHIEVELLATKLRRLFHDRAGTTSSGTLDNSKCFEKFRPNKRGQLSRAAFREGLESLGFPMSDSEFRLLVDQFDLNRDGYIEFGEFEAFVRSDMNIASRSARSKSSSQADDSDGNSQGDDDVDEIEEELRKLVLDAQRSGVSVQESFEHFDTDYSGEIGVDDLKRGLRKLKFNINNSQVRSLMRRFAGRNRSTIRLSDFFHVILPDGGEQVERAITRFRRMLSRTDVERSFRHFERDRNGDINRVGFKHGMEALKFELTDSELRIIMDVLDRDGDGKISFSEFLDFAKAENEFASNGARSLDILRKVRGKNPKRTSSRRPLNESDEVAIVGNPKSKREERNSVTVELEKIKFSPHAIEEIGRGGRFMIEFKFMNSRQQTETVALAKGRESATIGYSVHFPMPKGSELRKQFQRALEGKKSSRSSILFRVLRVRSSGKTVVLGSSKVDLLDILDEGDDMIDSTIRFTPVSERQSDSDESSSRSSGSIAKMSCSIRALSLLEQFDL